MNSSQVEILEELIDLFMSYINEMYYHRGYIGEKSSGEFYKELQELRDRLKGTTP